MWMQPPPNRQRVPVAWARLAAGARCAWRPDRVRRPLPARSCRPAGRCRRWPSRRSGAAGGGAPGRHRCRSGIARGNPRARGLGGVVHLPPVYEFELLVDAGPSRQRERVAAAHRTDPGHASCCRREAPRPPAPPAARRRNRAPVAKRSSRFLARARATTASTDGGRPGLSELGRRRRVADDLVDDGEVVVAVEGALVGEQLVEHHAGREQVGARVDLLALHLLGRHVLERARPCCPACGWPRRSPGCGPRRSR